MYRNIIYFLTKPMPNRLKQRSQKIENKRKATSRRDFLLEIASWMPMNLSRKDNIITPYYQIPSRIWSIIHPLEFEKYRANMPYILRKWSIFDTMTSWLWSLSIAGNKILWTNENTEYTYITMWSKNIYLSLVSVESENIVYSYSCFSSKEVYGSILIENSSLIYQSRCINNSFKIFFCSNIQDSNNIRFSSNLTWCSFCFNCFGLKNKSYCIDNRFVGKDIYEKKLNSLKSNIIDKYKENLMREWMNIGENITWSFNKNCFDVENGLMNFNLSCSRNVVFANATTSMQNVLDSASLGWPNTHDIYACMGVWYWCSYVYCSVECSPYCQSIFYSYLLDSCSFCLWCIWLKNKSYCIFNKQYTKDERYDEVDKIFTHMEKDWQLWEFFHWSMNPFYFNDTAAYLIDPSFTKEEVTAKWYLWRDEPIKVDIPDWMETVQVDELWQFEWFDSDWIWTIDPDILKKIIIDTDGNSYRIIKMEYDFLVKHGLPLPRKHWLERMKDNFKIG